MSPSTGEVMLFLVAVASAGIAGFQASLTRKALETAHETNVHATTIQVCGDVLDGIDWMRVSVDAQMVMLAGDRLDDQQLADILLSEMSENFERFEGLTRSYWASTLLFGEDDLESVRSLMTLSKRYMFAYAQQANPTLVAELTDADQPDLGSLKEQLDAQWDRMWLRCRETVQGGTP